MNSPRPRKLKGPPEGTPPGTIWFGGPVDRFRVTLRIFGETLDPSHITGLLECAPTEAETKGQSVTTSAGTTRISKRGRWFLEISSDDCGDGDVEDGILLLLSKLPDDSGVWRTLTDSYAVDVYCGLFFGAANRGFVISAELSRMLAERNVKVGFDVYFDVADDQQSPGSRQGL